MQEIVNSRSLSRESFILSAALNLAPPKASTHFSFGPVPHRTLRPEEEEHISSRKVHPRRENDYRRGRACAHSALEYFGLGTAAVLTAATREPVWPPGIVGSITHCDGLAGASVTLRRRARGIGLDAERRDGAFEELKDTITTAAEQARRPSVVGLGLWCVLSFSAKESIFKALYPETKTFFGFADVELTIDPERQTFVASCVGDQVGFQAVQQLQGFYAVLEDYVVTSAIWPC